MPTFSFIDRVVGRLELNSTHTALIRISQVKESADEMYGEVVIHIQDTATGKVLNEHTVPGLIFCNAKDGMICVEKSGEGTIDSSITPIIGKDAANRLSREILGFVVYTFLKWGYTELVGITIDRYVVLSETGEPKSVKASNGKEGDREETVIFSYPEIDHIDD